MGEFGLPPDGVAWGALVGALLWLYVAFEPNRRERVATTLQRHYRGVLWLLAISAALLSLLYVVHYLRGGPRIIDATAYLQQAKTFATGQLTQPAFEPSAATRGRFLYLDPHHNRLAVLFPPGYAAALSLGVLLRAPWVVGVLIAAALVASTAALTLRIYPRKDAALLAGLFSATTMVLRYHTADTMAHGLTALLVTTTLFGALRGGTSGGALAGLSLGWLLATRPVTFAALALVVAWYLVKQRVEARFALTLGVLMIPGCALWILYQWVSTGSITQPTQMAYYTVADGPPGCFRYGFGKGVGCLFEHGAYVESRLPNGYGPLQAAYVTLLRLRWHALDIHNFEPLAIATALALGKAFARRESKLLGLAILGVVLAYVPFYFDGSFPGGGARLLVDMLPLEHVLVAGWLINGTAARWFVPLSLAGFAFHGAFEHGKLRDRDGGRPMYEASALAKAGVESGLVFIDTDHGFLLGHDPAKHNPLREVVVLRHHGDAHDRDAWQRLGQPAAYSYGFDPTRANAQAYVSRLDPGALLARDRYEAESQWPALAVTQGWIRPVYPPNGCTSARRGLSLEPVATDARLSSALPLQRDPGPSSAQPSLSLTFQRDKDPKTDPRTGAQPSSASTSLRDRDLETGAHVQLSLYAAKGGLTRLGFGFVAREGGRQSVSIGIAEREIVVDRDAQTHECFEIDLGDIPLRQGEQPLIVATGPRGIVLDYWRVLEAAGAQGSTQ